jgi:hypothetical protein
MRGILTGFIFLTLTFMLMAQDNLDGQVTIQADPLIDELVQLHIAYNEEFPILEGYRIQLFMESGNEALSKAEDVKDKFEKRYNKVPAYITFGEPYYRVRVGDFRTRLDAENFLNRINRVYRNAWVTLDIINLPELPKHQKTSKYE